MKIKSISSYWKNFITRKISISRSVPMRDYVTKSATGSLTELSPLPCLPTATSPYRLARKQDKCVLGNQSWNGEYLKGPKSCNIRRVWNRSLAFQLAATISAFTGMTEIPVVTYAFCGFCEYCDSLSLLLSKVVETETGLHFRIP